MNLNRIDQIIDEHEGEAGSLIQVMLDIQTENRWLPREAIERVGERLEIPVSRIRHIATFYKAFSLVPKGRHQVHICVGTACHVRGAPRILGTMEDLTGIKPVTPVKNLWLCEPRVLPAFGHEGAYLRAQSTVRAIEATQAPKKD